MSMVKLVKQSFPHESVSRVFMEKMHCNLLHIIKNISELKSKYVKYRQCFVSGIGSIQVDQNTEVTNI